MTMRYMHLSPGARNEAVRLLERKSAEAAQEASKQIVDGDETETVELQLMKPNRSEVT
jgi:hypothetical protein